MTSHLICIGEEERDGAAVVDEGSLKDWAVDREGSPQRVEGDRGGQERRAGGCISQSEHCSIAQQ